MGMGGSDGISIWNGDFDWFLYYSNVGDGGTFHPNTTSGAQVSNCLLFAYLDLDASSCCFVGFMLRL